MVMKKGQSPRRVPDEKAATTGEIRAAIEALSDADLIRLDSYAKKKINGLGRKSLGREHKDLLHEAVTLSLAGDRRWNKTVSFTQHLIGVIRSTASNWAKKFDPDEPRQESEVIRSDPEGHTVNPLMSVTSADPNPESQLELKQQLDAIEQVLDRDQVALDVFHGLRDRMTGLEIQEVLGLSKTEYETVVKRIYRRARAILKNG